MATRDDNDKCSSKRKLVGAKSGGNNVALSLQCSAGQSLADMWPLVVALIDETGGERARVQPERIAQQWMTMSRRQLTAVGYATFIGRDITRRPNGRTFD